MIPAAGTRFCMPFLDFIRSPSITRTIKAFSIMILWIRVNRECRLILHNCECFDKYLTKAPIASNFHQILENPCFLRCHIKATQRDNFDNESLPLKTRHKIFDILGNLLPSLPLERYLHNIPC